MPPAADVFSFGMVLFEIFFVREHPDCDFKEEGWLAAPAPCCTPCVCDCALTPLFL